MKKIIIILILFTAGAVFRAEAQYGFGTNAPDPQAIIDANDPNKGMLVPRVSLQGQTSISPFTTTPTVSMLVWNTGVGGLTPLTPAGFYYWNGTQWVKLSIPTDMPSGITPGNLTSSYGTISISNGGTSALLQSNSIDIVKSATAYDVMVTLPTSPAATWGKITNDNISGTANIAVSKLATGGISDASKVLTVNSSGVPVWTSTQQQTTASRFYYERANLDANTASSQVRIPADVVGVYHVIALTNGGDYYFTLPTTDQSNVAIPDGKILFFLFTNNGSNNVRIDGSPYQKNSIQSWIFLKTNGVWTRFNYFSP